VQVLLSENAGRTVGDTGHAEHGGLRESSLAIPLVLSVVSLFTILIRSALAHVLMKGRRGEIADGHISKTSRNLSQLIYFSQLVLAFPQVT